MIVGLSGYAGSGKSAAADCLIDRGWDRVKFAGPLKAMTAALLSEVGRNDAQRYIEGDLKEWVIPEFGVSTRKVMQTLGTEWGRDCLSKGLWVDIAIARAKASEAPGVVIDDVRFDNEADAIRKAGGTVLRITGRGGIAGNHASEHLPDFDIEILNDGTLENLRAKILSAAGL